MHTFTRQVLLVDSRCIGVWMKQCVSQIAQNMLQAASGLHTCSPDDELVDDRSHLESNEPVISKVERKNAHFPF